MRCSQELMSLAELIKTCVPQAVKFIQAIPQIQPTVSKASRAHKARSGPRHAVCGPMKTVVGPNMICYWELLDTAVITELFLITVCMLNIAVFTLWSGSASLLQFPGMAQLVVVQCA